MTHYQDVDRLARLACEAQHDGIDWPTTWRILAKRLKPALRDNPAVEQRLYSAWYGTVEKTKRRRKTPG